METKTQVQKPTKEEGKKFLEDNSHSAWKYYLKQLFSSDTPDFSFLELSDIYCFYEQMSGYILYCDNSKLSKAIELSQKYNCQYVALHLLSYMYKEHSKLYSNAGIVLKEYLLKLSLTAEDKQQNYHLMWSYVALMDMDGINELKQEIKSSLNLDDKKALEKIAYVFMDYNGLGYDVPATFAKEISNENPLAALNILHPICKKVREHFEFDKKTNHLYCVCQMIVNVVKKINFKQYPNLKVEDVRGSILHPFTVQIYQHAVLSDNRVNEACDFLDKKLKGTYSHDEYGEVVPLLRTLHELGQNERAFKRLYELFHYSQLVSSKEDKLAYLDLFCDIITAEPKYCSERCACQLFTLALTKESLNLKTIALLPRLAPLVGYTPFVKNEYIASNTTVFNLLLSEVLKHENIEMPNYVFPYFKNLNVAIPERLKPQHDAYLKTLKDKKEQQQKEWLKEQEKNKAKKEQEAQEATAKEAQKTRQKEITDFFMANS